MVALDFAGEELKLELMRCPVSDFTAIRRALDVIEARKSNSNAVLMILSLAICSEASYSEDFEPLGESWYRRWRKESH